MLQNYLKIALRNLFHNKVFSFINIAGLSIGLACCMLIVLYTKDEVSYDRFHKNVNNIYRITTTEISPEEKMNKWLQDFAYRVEISWWIFVLAGIVAIAIALLTVSYQSIRASMANPVKSLRTE